VPIATFFSHSATSRRYFCKSQFTVDIISLSSSSVHFSCVSVERGDEKIDQLKFSLSLVVLVTGPCISSRYA